MKTVWKIVAIVFVILFFAIFFREKFFSRIYDRLSQIRPTQTSILPFPLYVHQKSFYEKFDCRNKIVFIGDSITTPCDWNELLDRHDIVNRAMEGDTTYGVLERLDFYLDQRPKCIFIMIGINDIHHRIDMDTIKSNHKLIIDKILSKNVQLFVQSTLKTKYIRLNKDVEMLNDYLVEQCKLLSVQYIDLNKKLLDNNLLSNKYSDDMAHLNGDGFIIWKEIISPYINRIPS